MTIEDIEMEWEIIKRQQTYHKNPPQQGMNVIDVARWKNAYMDKLIAVAKASKKHIEWCDDAGIDDGELQQALKELEKDE